mmetsp:Transcript_35091/g.80833  ORF Transcript_35091/g.80833 Transcript_35091/m.80833 type:complete len:269 (+) Transcript_35091:829-1635(+)
MASFFNSFDLLIIPVRSSNACEHSSASFSQEKHLATNFSAADNEIGRQEDLIREAADQKSQSSRVHCLQERDLDDESRIKHKFDFLLQLCGEVLEAILCTALLLNIPHISLTCLHALYQLSWYIHAFQCGSGLRHSLVTLQRPLVVHGRQKCQVSKHLCEVELAQNHDDRGNHPFIIVCWSNVSISDGCHGSRCVIPGKHVKLSATNDTSVGQQGFSSPSIGSAVLYFHDRNDAQQAGEEMNHHEEPHAELDAISPKVRDHGLRRWHQ